VQQILNSAQIRKGEIIKEAAGDYDQFLAVLPEYLANRDIFISRLLDDMYARALLNPDVAKLYVPPNAREYRLLIPRSQGPQVGRDKKEAGKKSTSLSGRKPERRMK
jgi:hypothetical protein